MRQTLQYQSYTTTHLQVQPHRARTQAGTCTCRISVANFIGGFSPSILCSSSSPISWRSRLIFSSVRDCGAEKGGRAGRQRQSDKIHCFYSQTTSYMEKNPFFTP